MSCPNCNSGIEHAQIPADIQSRADVIICVGLDQDWSALREKEVVAVEISNYFISAVAVATVDSHKKYSKLQDLGQKPLKK